MPVATLLEQWVADIIGQPSQNVQFQFSERHCLKIERQRAIVKDAYCPSQAFGARNNIHAAISQFGHWKFHAQSSKPFSPKRAFFLTYMCVPCVVETEGLSTEEALLCNHRNLITSQCSHLQIPSCPGVQFQNMNLEVV